MPTLGALFFLAACGGGGPEVEQSVTGKVRLTGSAMGTSWSVVAIVPEGKGQGMRGEIAREISQIELAMSDWIEESEVSVFNRAGAGNGVQLSAETVEVVDCALRVWRKSGGAFDITVGSGGLGVTSGDLKLDIEKRTLTKTREGVQIDLSAIAKGYAVDAVADLLEGMGVANYLIEIGGELRAAGINEDNVPWTVAVEEPDPASSRLAGKISLIDQSVATSGNYRQPKHLIDPDSARPVQVNLTAVSVLHHSAMEADAWATALFVSGKEKGLELAESLGLQAAFIECPGDGGEMEIEATPEFPWKSD